METRSRLVELYYYLQDPHLVARFQNVCGVQGTFSRTVSAGSTTDTSGGSSRAADRAHSHNNGACYGRISGKSENKNVVVCGDGEGERGQTTADGVRRRTVDSVAVKSRAEEEEPSPPNGAVMSEATAGGDAVSSVSDGETGTGHGATRVNDREAEKSCDKSPAGSSTLKPLRKNSLTGETGQEFMIKNRFLYYLFTFGTELGNELFYILFFPFIMWNVDVFVSRKLIMVWVWVMYLGQCTKDVIGWSRPASPPVVKVEMFYNSEYSMPSTHAMSGTAIPFSLFFMTYGRWEVQYPCVLFSS